MSNYNYNYITPHETLNLRKTIYFYLLYSVDDLLCNVVPTVVEVF